VGLPVLNGGGSKTLWNRTVHGPEIVVALSVRASSVEVSANAKTAALEPITDVSVKPETFVTGLIMDSWVRSTKVTDARSCLVLQVAQLERPHTLVFVEADSSLVPNRRWLEDLGENLCHGSPVVALGARQCDGVFAATRLQLTR
jgi:hypothetical protein